MRVRNLRDLRSSLLLTILLVLNLPVCGNEGVSRREWTPRPWSRTEPTVTPTRDVGPGTLGRASP